MKKNQDKLIGAMSDIDPKYIEEYANAKKKKSPIPKLSAIAACLAVCIIGSAVFVPKLFGDDPNPSVNTAPEQESDSSPINSITIKDYYYYSISGERLNSLSKPSSGSELAIEWESTIDNFFKSKSSLIIRGHIEKIDSYERLHDNGTQKNGFVLCTLVVDEVLGQGKYDDVKVGDKLLIYKFTVTHLGEDGDFYYNADNEMAAPHVTEGVYLLNRDGDTNYSVIRDEHRATGVIPDENIWTGLSLSYELFLEKCDKKWLD